MLNKLILQGRFTQTPELRSTKSCVNVTRFTIASQRDRAGQNGEREADFIQCVAWRGTAEFICRHFSKGQSVILEGALRSTKWMEDDKTRYGTELEVSEAHFCGAKKEGDTSFESGSLSSREDGYNGGGVYPEGNFFSLGEDDDLPY